MVICFGLSWPLNITKAWKARTAKGMSVQFYAFIWIGYICGIVSKVIELGNGIATPTYVLFLYIVNLVMVSLGILIYIRNKKFDKKLNCLD